MSEEATQQIISQGNERQFAAILFTRLFENRLDIFIEAAAESEEHHGIVRDLLKRIVTSLRCETTASSRSACYEELQHSFLASLDEFIDKVYKPVAERYNSNPKSSPVKLGVPFAESEKWEKHSEEFRTIVEKRREYTIHIGHQPAPNVLWRINHGLPQHTSLTFAAVGIPKLLIQKLKVAGQEFRIGDWYVVSAFALGCLFDLILESEEIASVASMARELSNRENQFSASLWASRPDNVTIEDSLKWWLGIARSAAYNIPVYPAHSPLHLYCIEPAEDRADLHNFIANVRKAIGVEEEYLKVFAHNSHVAYLLMPEKHKEAEPSKTTAPDDLDTSVEPYPSQAMPFFRLDKRSFEPCIQTGEDGKVISAHLPSGNVLPDDYGLECHYFLVNGDSLSTYCRSFKQLKQNPLIQFAAEYGKAVPLVFLVSWSRFKKGPEFRKRIMQILNKFPDARIAFKDKGGNLLDAIEKNFRANTLQKPPKRVMQSLPPQETMAIFTPVHQFMFTLNKYDAKGKRFDDLTDAKAFATQFTEMLKKEFSLPVLVTKLDEILKTSHDWSQFQLPDFLNSLLPDAPSRGKRAKQHLFTKATVNKADTGFSIDIHFATNLARYAQVLVAILSLISEKTVTEMQLGSLYREVYRYLLGTQYNGLLLCRKKDNKLAANGLLKLVSRHLKKFGLITDSNQNRDAPATEMQTAEPSQSQNTGKGADDE